MARSADFYSNSNYLTKIPTEPSDKSCFTWSSKTQYVCSSKIASFPSFDIIVYNIVGRSCKDNKNLICGCNSTLWLIKWT